MAKRPIDLKRDSGFSGTVGTDDEGAIKEFLNVGSALLTIKERAIYKFQLADQIDPDRTNIDVPHVQQKIYSIGDSSEIVGRILLTAKYLFEHGMLDGRFDKKALLASALEFFDEVEKLLALSQGMTRDQDAAIAEFEKQKAQKSTLLLPSIGDLNGRVRSFVQHADHSMQRLLALCRIFYTLAPGKAWFDSLARVAAEEHQLEQEQIERLGRMVRFAQFLRNCRNCIEHPKPHQRIISNDFRMTQNAQIQLPSIEVVHDETSEPEISLSVFMENMTQSVVNLGESTMVFLATYHVMPGWEDKLAVLYFPEDQRRHPHVHYYFAANMGGQVVPVG